MGKIKHQPITSRTDFFYYAFRNILLVSLPLVIISGFVLSHLSLHSSATISNSESDNLTLTLSTSCTLSSSVEEAHTASLNGGQYEDDIGITKVNAYCNDNNGYSIYAIGSSGDIDGNTDLISNINDNYNIHTGIYDSSSVSSYTPSSWSMKLSPGSGTGINPDTGESIDVTPPTIRNNYDSYSIVPNVYTLVASRPSNTNMTVDTNASGSYFTTTYDIYAASFQPSGTYTGKVKYMMIHPQSNDPYRANTIEESFAGAGKRKVYSSKAGGYYYSMQDMTTNICNYIVGDGESTSAQLVDIRDSNIYWVTKLKDGHCWMTQNLDLAIGSTNVPLTSENTDLSTIASGSGIYSSGYTHDNGVWTWTPSSTAITSSRTVNYDNNTVVNWPNTAATNATPYSAEGGDNYFYTSNTTDPDTISTSLQACKNAGHTSYECAHYHVGNYYNWTAAIASNASGGISSSYTQASNSICPKGWRLPIATNSSRAVYEFGDLLYKQGITLTRTESPANYANNGFNDIRKTPLYFVRGGTINGGQLYNNGLNGGYWPSTVLDDATSYLFVFNEDHASPSSNFSRHVGRSVRCLAR